LITLKVIPRIRAATRFRENRRPSPWTLRRGFGTDAGWLGVEPAFIRGWALLKIAPGVVIG